MSPARCPGQDKRFWKANDVHDVPCPQCGHIEELWKDDIRRRCRRCGIEFANPHLDLACAQWCERAAECIGALPLEDRIITRLHTIFADDTPRLDRAVAVAGRVKALIAAEGGGDAAALIPAALLHDLPTTRESAAGDESPWTAAELLEALNVHKDVARRVVDLLDGHDDSDAAKLLSVALHDATPSA